MSQADVIRWEKTRNWKGICPKCNHVHFGAKFKCIACEKTGHVVYHLDVHAHDRGEKLGGVTAWGEARLECLNCGQKYKQYKCENEQCRGVVSMALTTAYLSYSGRKFKRFLAAVLVGFAVWLIAGLPFAPPEEKPPEGVDLRLMPWGDGTGVPTQIDDMFIIGTDDKNLLHIRMRRDGLRLIDIDETTVPARQAQAISSLKQQLPGLSPPHVMTEAEKAKLLVRASSIVDDIPPEEAHPGIIVAMVAGVVSGVLTARFMKKKWGDWEWFVFKN